MDADDKGTLRERLMFRAEMRAHGVAGFWELPTRQDFEHYLDANNLYEIQDTWLPSSVERRTLPELMEAVFNLTKEDITRIDSLTWKRVEEGLRGRDVQELLTLYNKRDGSDEVVVLDPADSAESALDVVHELRYDSHQMMLAAQDPSRFDEGRIEPTETGPHYHMTDEQYDIWGHSPETEAVVTREIVAALQAHGYHEDAIILTPHGDDAQVALGVPAHERTEDPELRRHLQEIGRDVARGVSETERRANSGEAVDREAYEARVYSPRRAAALEAAVERLPVREHPVYEQSRQALQEALADVLEQRAAWHPETPEWYQLHEEAEEIRATLARYAGREEPVEFVADATLPAPIDRFEQAQRQATRDGGLRTLPHINIDTSDPDLGQTWQDQLDALDARIAALTAGRIVEQTHEQDQGMSV
jgi:hypothetical protein